AYRALESRLMHCPCVVDWRQCSKQSTRYSSSLSSGIKLAVETLYGRVIARCVFNGEFTNVTADRRRRRPGAQQHTLVGPGAGACAECTGCIPPHQCVLAWLRGGRVAGLPGPRWP